MRRYRHLQLLGALLLGTCALGAHAVPLYQASGGQVGLHCPDPAQPGTVTSATPGAVVDASAPGAHLAPFRAWYARAEQHSLHARSRVSGSWGACPKSTALFEVDDLVFAHDTADFIAVALDVRYEGALSAAIPNDDGFARASVGNELVLNGIRGTNVSEKLWEIACGDLATCQGGLVIDEVLTHGWAMIPTNTAIRFRFGLNTQAETRRNFGVAGSAEANFQNSALFANPLALFDVPDGTTVSSVQLGLVNNSINGPPTPVPTPTTAALLGLALVCRWHGGRRRR
ncbi:MAG: hypothetical protein AB7Q81_23910 [Gammaproteobacteria bacterium]